MRYGGFKVVKTGKKRYFYGIFYPLNGVKSRQNCDIDFYFGNILLQLPINIDYRQSQRPQKFILIVHRPLKLFIGGARYRPLGKPLM